MGSSAKTGKKIFYGSQEQFLDKTVIWDRTPPPIYQMQCICVGEGSRVPNLQTEFNYLDSFKSYGIFSDFVVPVVPALSPWSPCHPHHPHSPQKVPMWSPLSPPMLSPSSPRHLEGPQINPNPPDRDPTHPHPLGGWGAPNY